MKDILSIVNVTFMSFGMVLFLSSFLWTEPIPLKFIYQLFFCTFIISVLMHLTNKLEIKLDIDSLLLIGFLKIMDICIVVFPLGMGVFKFLPFTLKNVIIILAIILLTFSVGFMILLIDDMKTARRINEKIQKMKKLQQQ